MELGTCSVCTEPVPLVCNGQNWLLRNCVLKNYVLFPVSFHSFRKTKILRRSISLIPRKVDLANTNEILFTCNKINFYETFVNVKAVDRTSILLL
jgi:hypothetical protein